MIKGMKNKILKNNTASSCECELMGFSFNQSVLACHLVSAFRHRGGHLYNRDGWGIAFYPDKSVQIFKEPKCAKESNLAEFLTSYEFLKTHILIAHLRGASVGGRAYQNTHPFNRELNGKQYVLAHTGKLSRFQKKLKLGRIKPIGINDSEFLLCYILGQIEKKKIQKWDKSAFIWLQKLLQKTNDIGKLNCLFSDGEYLFAYHDKNNSSELHYLIRKPYGSVYFKDLKKKVNLSKIYPKSAAGIIIATQPLTDEPWVRFEPGQLMVLKDGKIVLE